MTGQRKKRIAGSYFVSTLSISLVLVVVGILVFILLNAKLVSDHVKQNIGFSIIVKDNVNEADQKDAKDSGHKAFCLVFGIY